MTALLLVLLAIALLDSTSMVPVCVVPFAAVLGVARPWPAALGFLAGVFAVYAGLGLLLMVGMDALFDAVAPRLARWWNDPNAPELVAQAALGAAMVGFAWRLATARRVRQRSQPQSGASPGAAFALGGGLTLAGAPGAFPYFGAIDQILRADLGPARSALALLFYNAIFIAPLAALLGVRLLAPGRSEAIFGRVAALAERRGRQLGVAVLALVGAVLTADALGWFLGHPLLPVEPLP